MEVLRHSGYTITREDSLVAATLLTQNLFTHGYVLGKLCEDLSVLNLFQAAELLLKAAVSRQDAGRIFTQKSLKKHCKDPACPTESELHRCQSVKISELCELIKLITGVNFRIMGYS